MVQRTIELQFSLVISDIPARHRTREGSVALANIGLSIRSPARLKLHSHFAIYITSDRLDRWRQPDRLHLQPSFAFLALKPPQLMPIFCGQVCA